MWESDVVSVMKADFIEKDKDRCMYRWLPKMATSSKGSIGSLWASGFCERIDSCANQILTLGNILLGDGKVQNYSCVACETFIKFMRKHYPQVADEQFEFGILKAEDNEKEEDEYRVDLNYKLIYFHSDLPVNPPRTHHIHHDIHDIHTFVNYSGDSKNLDLSNLQRMSV